MQQKIISDYAVLSRKIKQRTHTPVTASQAHTTTTTPSDIQWARLYCRRQLLCTVIEIWSKVL